MKNTNYKYFIIGLILIIIGSCVTHKISKIYLKALKEADYEFLEYIPNLMEEEDTIIQYSWKEGNIFVIDNKPPKNNEFNTDTISTNRYFRYLTYNFREFKLKNWHRDTANILIIHNIIKRIGYKNFISDVEYNKSFESRDNNYTIGQYIDSLIFNYNINTDTSNYYYKFWLRRKNEQTGKTLFCIINKIKSIYKNKESNYKTPEILNDTIYKLLDFDYKISRNSCLSKNEIVLSYFDYLKSIGLEISAFNLIKHVEIFDSLQINRDSLILTLDIDTITKSEWTNLYDLDGQGKWIFKKFYWGP